MERNDAQLIHQILQGDQEAFSPLVKKYQKGVHTLAWRKIGDFHIAQEITQDTFLKAYQKLGTLKNASQFPGWLYVIASNLCNDYLRRNRLPMESLDAEDAGNTSEVDKVSYSKYVSEKRESEADEARREVVKKLLRKLPESERTVMMLHYLGEMTIKAISEFLGVSQNTVKSRLSRARNRLRKEEDVLQQNLGSFQLPDQLAEGIMREVSRLSPVPTPVNKPVAPLALSAVSAVVLFLLIGVGTQHLSRFQTPYNLNATSEPRVEIIDAVFVYDSPAKPAVRIQAGRSITPGKGSGAGQKPDEVLHATLPIDAVEIATPKPQWVQTQGPQGGGVQSLFATANGDFYAGAGRELYRLAGDGSRWILVNAGMSADGAWQMTEHGNTLYIVSDTEIRASEDRGETWNPLGARPEGQLMDLVITGEAFYLGLVEGVFRSVDAGQSWTALNDADLVNREIRAIAAVGRTLFVGTDAGLYRRNLEGWKHLAIDGETESIRALASAGHRLYVAVGEQVKNQDFKISISIWGQREKEQTVPSLYRSTDMGDSWQPLAPIEKPPSEKEEVIAVTTNLSDVETKVYPDIKIIAGQEHLSLLYGGNSYYSSDAGETWEFLDSNTAERGNASALVSLNASTFYRGGFFGIYRTTDAGKTWHPFSTGLVKTGVINLAAVRNVLYANIGRSLMRSSDGGESWTPVSGSPGNLTYIAGFNNVLYARGFQENSVPFFRLSAEGLAPVPGMPMLDEVGPGELLRERTEAVSLEAQDGLEQNIDTNEKPNPEDFDADAWSQDTQDLIEENLVKILTALFGSFAVSGDTYYMEYEQKLFRWKPGMTQWFDTGLTDEGAGYLFGDLSDDSSLSHFKLAVSGDTLYVGKRDGHLFQSFDKGDTWNDVTANLPFPVASFNAVTFAGSAVYVATDKGVVASSDGTHWHTLTDAEGTPVVIEKLAVDGPTVYGTGEQRVYQLKENLGVWQQVTPEIPVPVTDLTVDGNVLYVGTRGQGVFRFTLD